MEGKRKDRKNITLGSVAGWRRYSVLGRLLVGGGPFWTSFTSNPHTPDDALANCVVYPVFTHTPPLISFQTHTKTVTENNQ